MKWPHPSIGLRPDDGPGPGRLPRPALRAARTPGTPWGHLAVDHWGKWNSKRGHVSWIFHKQTNISICLLFKIKHSLHCSQINFVLWSMCVRYYDRQVWKPSIWRVPGVTAVKISQISQTALSKDNEAWLRRSPMPGVWTKRSHTSLPGYGEGQYVAGCEHKSPKTHKELLPYPERSEDSKFLFDREGHSSRHCRRRRRLWSTRTHKYMFAPKERPRPHCYALAF